MSNSNILFQIGAGSLSTENLLGTIVPLVLMIAIFYLGIIRPQKKKEKEVTSMRESLSVGDEILTIGGISGKIIQVKKDMIVMETTGMHTRLEVMKWGIHSVTKEKLKKDSGNKDQVTSEDIEEN